jgi:DNA-binding GntR family transcriptional regulator
MPVVHALRARIARGVYPPGAQLPSRAQIEAEWRVSDRSARRAVAVLAEEGWVVSRQGHGTYVAERPPTGEEVRARRTHSARRLHPADAPDSGENGLTATPAEAPAEIPADITAALGTGATATRHVLSDTSGPVAVRTVYSTADATTPTPATVTTFTYARTASPDEADAMGSGVVLGQDEHHTDPDGRTTTVVRTIHRADAVRLADAYQPR